LQLELELATLESSLTQDNTPGEVDKIKLVQRLCGLMKAYEEAFQGALCLGKHRRKMDTDLLGSYSELAATIILNLHPFVTASPALPFENFGNDSAQNFDVYATIQRDEVSKSFPLQVKSGSAFRDYNVAVIENVKRLLSRTDPLASDEQPFQVGQRKMPVYEILPYLMLKIIGDQLPETDEDSDQLLMRVVESGLIEECAFDFVNEVTDEVTEYPELVSLGILAGGIFIKFYTSIKWVSETQAAELQLVRD
jgi:hypothetical protein